MTMYEANVAINTFLKRADGMGVIPVGDGCFFADGTEVQNFYEAIKVAQTAMLGSIGHEPTWNYCPYCGEELK